MGKVKLPDDINDWEKRSLREDIGTSEEHKHTIYVYKDFAIEHEEDECCNNWNPYVIVNGHPLKLHEGYFHNFDEALGYLKGAIKEKELVDFDNSPDEPEFPKAKTEDMHKGIQLPTAREMFAEAHCLPDADALRQSYKEHRSQMYDMLFNARKAEDEDNDSEGGGEEGQPKKQLVQSDIFQYGVGGAPGAKKNSTYGKGEYREGDAPTFKQPTFNTYKEGFKLQTPYIIDGQVKHKTSTIPFTGSRLVQPETEGVSVPTIPVETSFGTATVAQPTGLPTSGYEREGRMGFKTAKKFGEETDSLVSPQVDEREKKVRQTKGDTSFKTQSRTFDPEGLVMRRMTRDMGGLTERYLDKDMAALVADTKQGYQEQRAQEIAEGGKATTAMPRVRGITPIGTFSRGDGNYPMIPASSNYLRTFFSNVPKAGGPRKGIYAAIDAHNAMVDLMDPNDPRIVHGLIRKYDDNVGNLTPAQIRNLAINNYRIKDPTTGAFTARPEYSEQLDYLGGIDLTQDLFNPDGSLNGRAWSAIQRGDTGPVQPHWTHLKYTDVSANPDKPNPYLHITGTGGWSPHDNVIDSDYRLARSRFDKVRNNSLDARRFLNSGMTINQLNELKKEFSPAELSRMMGYNFDGQEKPPLKQTGVEVEDRFVPEENRTTLDFTPETSGQDAAVSKKEKGLVAQASAWADVVRNAEETGEWDSDELMAASTGLQELVTKNPQFVLKYPDLFYEEQVQEAIHALQEQVHEFTEEQQIENLLNNMSTTERLDFIKNDLGIDDYKERNGVAHAFWKNATKQQARLILQKLREWYEMQGLDADQVSSKYYDLNASMRGENMDDVMKAKQAGLGDFKDTPESEKKEHKPAPKKKEPKVADVGSFGDGTEAESTPLPPPEPKRKQADLSGNIVKDKPLGSENTWSDNPTAPTAQIRLDEVEERPPEPEAPSPQMSLDQGWTSTAPQFDPLARIKDYGVNMFGSMQLQDWYKALMATDPTSPEYANQLKALQFRVGFDPNISELERATYGPLLKRAEANVGIPAFKSFREEMEKSISDKDAAAGIPTGFMGTHPMTSPYKRVELGYGKDATYPFVLRNALTGEKVCDVTDNPRENSD